MENQAKEGLGYLREMLSLVGEVLLLARVTPNPTEKDIHREIREAFSMRTKIEKLSELFLLLHKVLIGLHTQREEHRLWNHSLHPSPWRKEREKNKKLLKEFEGGSEG